MKLFSELKTGNQSEVLFIPKTLRNWKPKVLRFWNFPIIHQNQRLNGGYLNFFKTQNQRFWDSDNFFKNLNRSFLWFLMFFQKAWIWRFLTKSKNRWRRVYRPFLLEDQYGAVQPFIYQPFFSQNIWSVLGGFQSPEVRKKYQKSPGIYIWF